MKLKKLLSVILAAVLLLGCMSITAFAAGSVFYLDEAGETKTADCAEINSTTTDWSGWMTVDGNVTIGGSITLTDDTNLILQDGANLKVGAIEGGKTLTVYAQSTGNNAGMLSVKPSDSGSLSQCITGNLTVHGGIVDISAEGSTVYGIKNGSLTVTGGNVYMALTGSMSCYAVYAIQISGNAVTVTGGSVAINLSGRSCHGIYASQITGDCLNISGGQVKVDMTALDGSAYGVYSSDSTGDTLNISGGKFVFDGVGSSVMGVYGSRITGNGLVVSGGEVVISVTASGTGSAVYSNVSIEDYYGIKHTGGTVNLHSNFSAASVRNISVLATEVSSDGENYSEWDGVTDPSEYHHLRFAAPEEPEDPSGVDLSMLTTGKKIQLGTKDDTTVEWVIGGDGTDGMSVPEGCIALVSSDLVASGVVFSSNESKVYATSNLRTVVEGAVTFSTDEQAIIQERTLAGNQNSGSDCDGVAGDSVTATVWAPTTKDAYALNNAGLSAVGSDYWLCSPASNENQASFVLDTGNVFMFGNNVGNKSGVRAALYLDLSKVTNVTLVEGTTDTYILNAPEEPSDPSGVDLSMLTTGKKIIFGTQDDTPVEWVIGGDGETGMSVPTGCIALVSSDIVLSGVKFIANPDDGNAYATSNLRTVVEGAVTFTDDEQAVIQERTLAGNQSYGDTCDGVAGDSVIATVWAPTTKDAGALYSVHLSEVSEERCIYWLCSPGYRDDFAAIVIDGEYEAMGKSVGSECGVRAALYLDLSKVYGAEAVEGKENTYTLVLTAPSTFLTSFTLSKDYDDKYSTGNKTTAVTDTVTFTITPVVSGDPAFETVTVNVASGEGSADVTLPEYTKAGEYWYTITETAGTTAGVTYNTDTYYLHVIVDYEDGVYGVRSAQIHLTGSSDYDPDDASDKITTVSNSYGEGKLTVTQNVTFNGGESTDNTAEFVETVTFTLPAGTVITGNVTYGEGDDEVTITPEQWTDGSVSVDITLKNGASVTFSGLPDGATYTVEQKTAAESYGLESVEFNDPDTGDTVNNNVASGTIGDAADSVTVTNAGFSPLDVGVILESGAFILLALGAIAAGAWLIVSKRRRSLDAE